MDVAQHPLWGQAAVKWTMPEFVAAYTVHDSHLGEVRITRRDGLFVLIDWDLHWNPHIPASHQTLAIHFPFPYAVRWREGAWRQSTLSEVSSTLVPEAERERMLGDGTVQLEAYRYGQTENEIRHRLWTLA